MPAAPSTNCITAPLAVKVCTPSWAPLDSLRILEWDSGLVVEVDPQLVELEPYCPPPVELEAQVSDLAERLDQSLATVAHLRSELRDCRADLAEAVAARSQAFAAPNLSLALFACLAVAALWLRRNPGA